MKLTPQNQLPNEQRHSLKWGSHTALNISVMKAFPITGVLELGAGMHSTKLFCNHVDHVVSIEADNNWIQKLITEKVILNDNNQKLIHHKLPDHMYRGTLRTEISPQVFEESIVFYKSHITNDINYMFVDNYAGFRLEAIQKMYQQFDVIAYHDAEPVSDLYYDYSKFTPTSDYYHFIDETFIAHTGILISKKFANYMDVFQETFKRECYNFASTYNTTCNPTLKVLQE